MAKTDPRPHGRYWRGPKPHIWKSGPNPIAHDKYVKWLKHKSQASFRGELHDLTFEQWCQLWPDYMWTERGKSADCLCLTMDDPKIGWSLGNVAVITRKEQLMRQGFMKRGTKYRKGER